jgi:NDP-sugar pyrophosphorylase family protein
MILAAGYGTRLWPLTADRTKPAIPILGKPLIGYVAEYLAGHGVSEVVVNLHHEPASVRNALGDGSQFGVRLRYVEEPIILGTSGALDNVKHLFQDETFITINGKIITDIDLGEALRTHRERKALATLVLMENRTFERFSEVKVKDGLIEGFGGMPLPASDNDNGAPPPLMFTGIQILEPRIFKYIPVGRFSHTTTDVYPQAIEHGEVIAAHVADGLWRELSTLNRYRDISLELLQRGYPGASNHVGQGCYIADGAVVESSILWDGIRIETDAAVRNCVIGDGVMISSGVKLSDAVVVRAELVQGTNPPEKSLKGVFQDDNFVVSLRQ